MACKHVKGGVVLSGLSDAAESILFVILPVFEAGADNPFDLFFIDRLIDFPDDGDR
jgi:hypothetical protein